QLVQRKIFTPLGMSNSGFVRSVQADDLPKGYNFKIDNDTFSLSAQPLWKWTPAYNAAGGIVATPADLMRWLHYNMGMLPPHGNDLINRHLLGEIFEPGCFNRKSD